MVVVREDILFDIQNLRCEYDSGKLVLDIPSLQIPKGKFVGLLSVSGGGKSTLLETLGLMHKTFKDGSKIIFYGEDGKEYNFSELWAGNEAELSKIRKEELGFIFQQANLMPNFTAHENICLAQLLSDDGMSEEEAMKSVNAILGDMGLEEIVDDKSRLVMKLSGGQRQRVAFARAINSKFSVLFGDEPTGNLDPSNARNLIQHLKNRLTQSQSRSALIVSHDLEMMSSYADVLMVITKNKSDVGTIEKQNIYYKQEDGSWKDGKGAILKEDIKLSIKRLMEAEKTSNSIVTTEEVRGAKPQLSGNSKVKRGFQLFRLLPILLGIETPADKRNFFQLFFSGETRELLGHKNRNFWVLLLILLVTFWAIGLANGSIKYLSEKMNDPYINWLHAEIPESKSDKIAKILQELNTDNCKKEFQYRNIVGDFRRPINFWNPHENYTTVAVGRSISIDDPLLEKIISNKKIGRSFETPEEIGVIVTDELLNSLGYPQDTVPYYILLAIGDGHNVPLPVIAHIDKLPGVNQLAFTPYFYNQCFTSTRGFPFDRRIYDSELIIFLPKEDEKEAKEFAQLLKGFMKNKELDWRVSEHPQPNNQSYQKGFNIEVYIDDTVTLARIDSIFAEVSLDSELKSFNPIRWYKYRLYPEDINLKYHYISANFESLLKVRDFADSVRSKYNIKIDLALVETRDQFRLVSDLTFIISLILLIFSIVSISFFLSGIFRVHLNNVKMNIGTFKAFGLSNQMLTRVYLEMILRLLCVALVCSLGLAWLSGELGVIRCFLWFLNPSLEEGESYFSLISYWTGIALILILIINTTLLYRTIKGILNKTPGELIYGRDKM